MKRHIKHNIPRVISAANTDTYTTHTHMTISFFGLLNET